MKTAAVLLIMWGNNSSRAIDHIFFPTLLSCEVAAENVWRAEDEKTRALKVVCLENAVPPSVD